MEQLRLERINDDNVYEIINLRVRKEQKGFVARNVNSIVHAYLNLQKGRPVFPFGIYVGKKPVGFLMIGYDIFGDDREPDPNCDWFLRNSYIIWRLMIDRRYQGRGYGRKAMEQALEFVRSFPCGEAEYCWVSYEPENLVAQKLYRSLGFEEVPAALYEGGEMPAVLHLQARK